MKNKKGFTLVELIAVIAVLAVLVLVALPNVLGVFNKSIEEVMKIEETQATDAGNLYVRDHCGRTAKSKTDRSKCRNDVTTQKIEDKVYFCLSEIRGKGYIDEIKYKGNTKCDGIVLYDYDDEEVKFSEGKTYLVCDNDLYITPELKEKEESIFNEYKKIINECPDSSYEPAPAPEPTPGSTPNPDSNENNNMYKVIVVHDVIGIGDEEIYLKYGIGWYSDANGANAINKINTKVKTGHTLKGYYTEQNGNGIQIIDENGNINSGTTTAISTEISSIYAYWEPSKFYITYNANGGTGEKMPDTLFEYGVEQALSKNTYTRKGYTFAGWSQSANTPVTYTDSQVVKFTPLDTSNWNLYAIWTPSIYKLTLNNDGATTPGTPAIYEKYNTGWYSEQAGTNSLTSIVVPVKKGYTFNGYNLNGAEIIKDTGEINNNTRVINTDSEALARYTPRTYSVILNNDGADTPGTPAIYLKYNTGWYSNYETTDSISKITVPKKLNHLFEGYYTGEDGEGTQVIDKDGNIKNGNTKIFSNETNTGVLYAKWKYDYACTKREMKYIGKINTVSTSGSYSIHVNDVLEKKQYDLSLATHYYTDNYYSEFGIDIKHNDGGPFWEVYARSDSIYYSFKETTNESELKPLSTYSWFVWVGSTIYLYDLGCVKSPESYTYVGEVHTASMLNNESSFMLFAVDRVNNKKERLKWETSKLSGVSYSEFGVGVNNNDAGPFWEIYAQNDDIFYSFNETTNESDLKPFSTYSWFVWIDKKIYFYKKNKVETPKNYTYVGEVHSATTGDKNSNFWVYVVDKVNNKREKVKWETSKLSGVSYSEFGVGVNNNDGGPFWEIYAQNDDIFYSFNETTNESDLKPFSTINWHIWINRKVYIYKKNKVDTPKNYTYVGEVHSATTGDKNSNFWVYVVDKVNNKREKVKWETSKLSGVSYSEFGVGVNNNDGGPFWEIYAQNDDIFYSFNETTKESDLKPFSTINWHIWIDRKVYIYKKNKVDTPKNYTYVGEVHSATTGDKNSNFWVYVVDKVNNKREKVKWETSKLSGVSYSEFGVGVNNNAGGPFWEIYAQNDDIFYSFNETTNESDLKPFSTYSWFVWIDKKIYFYKKNKVDTPKNYTYVGEIHSATTGDKNENFWVYVVDKVNNKKEKVKWGNVSNLGLNYSKFKLTVSKNSSGPFWEVYPRSDSIYYSLKETTNESDLKSLSTYSWYIWNNAKVYLYIKQ